MNLTRRLFLLVFIALLPAVAILSYDRIVLRQSRSEEVRDLARRNAELAASEIDRMLEGLRNLLAAISKVDAVRQLEPAACGAYLAALKPEMPHLNLLRVIDLKGDVRCRDDDQPFDSVRVDDRTYFREAVASGGFVVGELIVGRRSGRPTLPVAAALKDRDGTVVGIVAAMLNLDWLSKRLEERGVPPGGSITVADRNGIIIARFPQPERFVGTRIPDAFQDLVRAETPGVREITSQDGTRRYLGYVPSPMNDGLYVSSGVGADVAYAILDRSWRNSLLLGLVGLALAIGGAWAAARVFIRRPMQRLLAASEAWRAHRLDVRSGLTSRDGEFGRVGAAFDEVVAAIRVRESALEASEASMRLAVEAGRMGTWSFDIESGRQTISERSAAILGLSAEQVDLDHAQWRALLHPEDRAGAIARWSEVLATGGEYESEYRIVRADGSLRWIHARGLVSLENGRPVRLAGIHLDVTARKEGERRQQLLIDELNHRVKNTLATVQSIAAQTLRTAPDLQAFKTGFEARLTALSATHNLLTRSQWRAADLRELLEQELAPYRREGAGAVLVGSPVELDAPTALSLGLIIHELTTNAVKHGALARPEGSIVVRWAVRPAAESAPPLLALTWIERGGPPVRAPAREGFGSRLLQRSINQQLQGTVRSHYEAQGLTCEIVVPLGRLAGDDGGTDAAASDAHAA